MFCSFFIFFFSNSIVIEAHLPSIEMSPHRWSLAGWQWHAKYNHDSLLSRCTGRRPRMGYAPAHDSRNGRATKTIGLQIIRWAMSYLRFAIASFSWVCTWSFWWRNQSRATNKSRGVNSILLFLSFFFFFFFSLRRWVFSLFAFFFWLSLASRLITWASPSHQWPVVDNWHIFRLMTRI